MSDCEAVQVLTIEDILKAWDLTQYAQKFKDEAIDYNSFSALLQEEWSGLLEKLIPVAGHRIRFKMNVKELIAVESVLDNKKENVNNLQSTNDSLSSCSDQPIVIDDLSSFPAGTSTSSRKRQSSTTAESQDKRSNADINRNSVKGQELRHLLFKSGTGRCLLAQAKKSNILKQEKDQNKIADIVVENEIVNSPSYRMKADQFPVLVEAIQSIFPGESSEIYYIPYRNDGLKRCLAKGKLIIKYYSLRKELKSLGEISSQRTGENSDSDDDVLPVVDGLEDKLNFLRDNIKPWETVLEYWKDTSNVRLHQLQRSDKSKSKSGKSKPKSKQSRAPEYEDESEDLGTSVAPYLARYPALRQRLGYTLFEVDFENLYPNHKLKVYSNFDDFYANTLKNLQDIERKHPALIHNLEVLETSELSKDSKSLVLLLSLCYLDTVVTVTRVKKQGKLASWRPPHPEIQEGVISQVESVGKMDSFIAERYEKFAGWKVPVQPFCVVVGPTIEDTDTCYVVLDQRTKYLFTSPLRALDICFKIIHAVHAEYSLESYRIWMFLQKALYGLNTKFDNLKSDAQLPKLLRKFNL